MTSVTAATGKPDIAPRIYLLLENPSKSNNLGPILRCATAFGVTAVIAIGFEKCCVEGSHGASKHVQIVAFPVGDQAVNYLRNECQCTSIVGLMGPLPDGYSNNGASVIEEESSGRIRGIASDTTETKRRSFPVDAFSFSPGNVCFVVSKTRPGLPTSIGRLCDAFVHVPHMTTYAGGELLLDTQSCLSILLHVYTNWANYDERTFQGHKFEVVKTGRMTVDDDKKISRSSDRLAKEIAVETAVSESALSDFFRGEYDDDF